MRYQSIERVVFNMKGRRMPDVEIERHEEKIDVWQEMMENIDEITAGGGKHYQVHRKQTVRAKSRSPKPSAMKH